MSIGTFKVPSLSSPLDKKIELHTINQTYFFNVYEVIVLGKIFKPFLEDYSWNLLKCIMNDLDSSSSTLNLIYDSLHFRREHVLKSFENIFFYANNWVNKHEPRAIEYYLW